MMNDQREFQNIIERMTSMQLTALGNLLTTLDARGLSCDPAVLAKEISGLTPRQLRTIGSQSFRIAGDAPAPTVESDEVKRRSAIDGGRWYELTLQGLEVDEARERWECEWQTANHLVATGKTIEQAWQRIRRDAPFYGDRYVHQYRTKGRRSKRSSRRA